MLTLYGMMCVTTYLQARSKLALVICAGGISIKWGISMSSRSMPMADSALAAMLLKHIMNTNLLDMHTDTID